MHVRAPGCAWWAAVLVARGALAEARGGSLIGSVWMLSLAALIGRPAHVTKRDTVDSSQAPHGFLWHLIGFIVIYINFRIFR